MDASPRNPPNVDADKAFIRRAVTLSKRGFPAPNPHVGCVVVLNGKIVGEGYHHRHGEAHAEVVALTAAGALARGATAYVTLEPCNHYGRTGPCTAALISAGIARVVYAVKDPNPRAAGGHAALVAAGVVVESGLLATESERANGVFIASERRQSPYVCLKAAMSLDGRIALPSGESKWITGPQARNAAHRLRADMGSVLVGPGTVISDDPQLTARFRGSPEIARIILDPRGDLPKSARVFDGQVRTIHVVPKGAPSYGETLEQGLVQGRFLPAPLLKALFARGIRGVLVEGGAKTLASFLPFADRVELFMSGKTMGMGPSWLEGHITDSVADAPRFNIRSTRKCGPDIRVSAYPEPDPSVAIDLR